MHLVRAGGAGLALALSCLNAFGQTSQIAAVSGRDPSCSHSRWLLSLDAVIPSKRRSANIVRDHAMILLDDATPKPDGIFGKDRVVLPRDADVIFFEQCSTRRAERSDQRSRIAMLRTDGPSTRPAECCPA
jgi:hypothetical protein